MKAEKSDTFYKNELFLSLFCNFNFNPAVIKLNSTLRYQGIKI